MQNEFGISYSDGKLLPLVKYRKLEVVFFQHKILVTVRSLNICLGRSTTCGNATGCPSVRIKKLLVLLKKADALALGLYGTRAVRVCMTIDGAKEYLKTSCRSPNATTVLEWIEREVEPAARKHLAALEAQEAKETKEMPEETPLLPSTETVPAVAAAPAVPSYEDLLAPWRATLKAQEDTLKELEAVKADLASRIARIDEQNADIKTLVENNNAFQDERSKLKEEIEAKEKEIESLKNSIIELEDKNASQAERINNAIANWKTLSDQLAAVCEERDVQDRRCAELQESLNAKDAELAKFKAFKDMMQSFMQTAN